MLKGKRLFANIGVDTTEKEPERAFLKRTILTAPMVIMAPIIEIFGGRDLS